MIVVKDEYPDEYPDHVLALLGRVMDGLRRDVVERGAAGAGAATGLRPSQHRLLSLTPVGGMRLTDLADRVGMTKQSLGEFVNGLEERGLLESVRDDRDRRTRIVRPTAEGLQAVVDGDAVIADVEEAWRARAGDAEWDHLRDTLKRMAVQGGRVGGRPHDQR